MLINKLKGVFVPCDNNRINSFCTGTCAQRTDDVIGFHALFFYDGDVACAHDVLGQCKLWYEIFWRFFACRFVVRKQFVTKCLARHIKRRNDILRLKFLQHIEQCSRKSIHGISLRAVRCGERWKCVKRPMNNRIAVQ